MKPTLKSLKVKAWKLVSEYIRRRKANWKGQVACYTCGIMKNWKAMHCGHWKHGKLDYDVRNLRPQCPQCNTFRHGNLAKYTLKLIEEYGIEWVQELERDANEIKKYSQKDLESIIQKFSELLKTL